MGVRFSQRSRISIHTINPLNEYDRYSCIQDKWILMGGDELNGYI